LLNFISGLPGNGKTLFAIQHLRDYQKSENDEVTKHNSKPENADDQKQLRQVYYHGINELKLDWEKLEDPDKWYKLPQGSIIVIDEAQKIFPPLANSAKKPLHYTEFDTHRHRGYDVYLITQDPYNIDFRVRSMAGRH